MSRSPVHILVFVLALLWGPVATAALALPDEPETSLGQHLEFLEDPSGELSLEEVRERTDWQASDPETFNKGFSDSAWWLRLTLDNPLNQSQSRLLAISYPVLDRVDVHLIPRNRDTISYQLGQDYPYSQRPMDHRYLVVPLNWAAEERVEVYLRVASQSAIQVPMSLWEPDAFHSHDITANILHGIYFGALLVIGIYNIMLFFALGDRNYLYYVGFVMSLGVLMLALTGFGFRNLWPAATVWNTQVIAFSISCILIFGALFIRRFLSVPEHSRVLDLMVMAVLAFSAAMAFLSFVLDYRLLIPVLIPLVVFGCLLAFFGGIYIWYRGHMTARYFVLAWFFLLAGGIVLALSKGGFLPSTFVTDYAVQIGSLIEVVLLSFALAQRINVEKRLRYEAQSETLATARRLNQELEERVRERTQELEEVNERLNELSLTDELTGLKNRRFLDRILHQEVERARRNERPLAVALLDIDHFKPVNDTYGHQVGDECLRLVGEIIHSGLRWPSDTGTRYGGEEFAIVFPDTDAEGALAVVERIRQRIRETVIEWEGVTLQLTVSGGIRARIIDETVTADEMLRGADEALYNAKESGRDRTCIYGSDD